MNFFRRFLFKKRLEPAPGFKIAVLGLGVFGQAVTRAASQNNIEVLAIDRERDKVNACKDYATEAVILDITNQEGLNKFRLQEYHAVIVAVGKHFENNFLATAYLKELGAPYVISRAASDIHARILFKIGADEVINPEEEIGEDLGFHLARRKNIHALTLKGDYAIIEVEAPAEMAGEALPNTLLQAGETARVLLVSRVDEKGVLNTFPATNDPIHAGDRLTVLGTSAQLEEFKKEYRL
ncbi:MAG: TrkA family potassium uptake protein [Turneriella sp.]